MKQLFQVKDETGTAVIQPVLSIRLGERHCSFSVSDAITKKVMQVNSYTADEIDEAALTDLQFSQPLLTNNFYEVLISYDFPESILMPSKEFDHEKAGLMLRSLYGVNGSSVIVSETIPEWQLYNIHAVPKTIFDWVSSRFSTGRSRNQYSINIKSLKAADKGGSLLIDFRKDEFSVIAAASGRFILAQTFPYSVPEDVIYYLLKLVQQCNLSQQDVLLQLSGLIDKQSALYKELFQYFINVEFRDADWLMPANEYPAHFFTSLNDLARCVS